MKHRKWLAVGASGMALSVLALGLTYSGAYPTSVSAARKFSSAPPKVTLLVAEWTNPPAIKATQVIDQAFEKLHPGVTVKLEYAPTAQGAWGALSNTLVQSKTVDVLAEFAPGSFVPPAYMHATLGGVQALAASGQLVNFKGMPFLNNFLPGVQQRAAGFRGGIYGVEMATYATTGVFYNKTLFAKYHLAIPMTWNQFIHDCQVFQSHHINPIYVAGKDGLQGMIFNAIMNSELPHVHSTAMDYQLDNAFWHKKTSWNAPIWGKIMARYNQAVKYFEPNWTGVAQLNAPGQWAASNNSAMLVDGSWDGYTIKTANPKLQYGWFPIPGSNQVKNNKMYVNGDFTWVVPTWAPQKKLAIQYVEFFSQHKNYQTWDNYVGCFPTQNVVSKLPWMTVENAYVKAGKTSGSLGISLPNNAGPLANFPGDTSELQPAGPYTIAELQHLATIQFQASLPKA